MDRLQQLIDLLIIAPDSPDSPKIGPDLADWLVNNGLAAIPDRQQPVSLQAARLQSLVVTGTYRSALEEILTELAAIGITPILLKGISIAHELYPTPAQRPMRDMDILVKKDQHAVVHDILTRLGYQQISSYDEAFYQQLHHDMPYYHPEKHVWLELHHGIIPPDEAISRSPLFNPLSLDNYTIESEFYGHPVLRFSHAFQLAYSCVHWAGKLNERAGVIPLLDAALLIQKIHETNQWEVFCDYIAEINNTASIYLMLGYLHTQHVVDIPASVLRDLRRSQRSINWLNRRLMYKLISQYMVEGIRPGKLMENTMSSIWFGLLQGRPSWLNLLALPWRILFPPGREDRFSLRFQWQRLSKFFRH